MFLRSIARPLLASWFIYGGIESLLEPEHRARVSGPVVEPVLKELDLDVRTTDLVKVHGAASIAAASVLALSKTPRTAGLALAGLATLTVAAGQPFWREEDEDAREEQRSLFFINLSLLGGTLLAATAGHSSRSKERSKARKAKKKARAQGSGKRGA